MRMVLEAELAEEQEGWRNVGLAASATSEAAQSRTHARCMHDRSSECPPGRPRRLAPARLTNPAAAAARPARTARTARLSHQCIHR